MGAARTRSRRNGVGLVTVVLVLGLLSPGSAIAGSATARPDPGSRPLSAPAPVIISVSAGEGHTCAVTSDGYVRCWGSNPAGQLGIQGNDSSISVPGDVWGLSGAVMVDTGLNHTCALMETGTVKCWGSGFQGQLGDGRGTMSRTPVAVSGITAAKLIAVGGSHSCAVLSDGSVRCWGSNYNSQLGDGTTEDALTPVTVTGVSDAIGIAAGTGHSCALLAGGTAKCWGYGLYGQLGQDSFASSATPVTVTGLTGATSIAAGLSHTCAVISGGTAKCWGGNDSGQLGDASYVAKAHPVVVAGLANAQSISVGSFSTCAALSGGMVKCWGNNEDGQLGDWSRTSSPTPVTAFELNGVGTVDVGARHACAITSGTVECWGSDEHGQLGVGSRVRSLSPVPVFGFADAVAIAAGSDHTCVIVAAGAVKCWGYNVYGQLGDGSVFSRSSPVDVTGLTGVTSISAGDSHTCVRVAGGTVKCWGGNYYGQLGDGGASGLMSLAPIEVPGLTGVTRVAAGSGHTCALLFDGTVKCWGFNSHGQLGDGTTTGHNTPNLVPGLTGASNIFAGANDTCALVAGGALKCWGDNGSGQFATASPIQSLSPMTVPGISGVTRLTMGWSHICAIIAGALQCWGANWQGQTGSGTASPSSPPVSVPGMTSALTLDAGYAHSCGVVSPGTLKCWGAGYYGQLGDGTLETRYAPQLVFGLPQVAAVATGMNHTCALFTDGTVNCWGNDQAGEVGDNRDLVATKPGPVVALLAVPAAPQGVTGARGNASATVTWLASSTGGATVTAYMVTSSPGGFHCATGGSLSCSVTGLTNGTPYTFTVRATNAIGTSLSSSASAAVVPSTVPGAPTTVHAVGGNASAVVSWHAPLSNGGAPITAYSVTSTPGGLHCSTSGSVSCTVTGLTNGTTYTFKVTATNAAGTGPGSAASNAVLVWPPQASTYHPLPPVRLLDTRVASPVNGHYGRISAGVPMTIQISGRGGVPAAASAVTGNLTVTGSSAAWALYLGPAPLASPGSSTINFVAGQTIANGLTVALSTSGKLSATYLGPSGATTDLVLDVTGYYTADTSGQTYHPIAPVRDIDTRSAGSPIPRLTAATPACFAVAGVNGVPTAAKAVTGNVTVTEPSAAWALYLGPISTSAPTTSNLNFLAGQTASNNLTVALSTSGRLCATYIGPAGATTHLVFDVTGYYTADLSGAAFVPVAPVRLLDTRATPANGLSGVFRAGVPRTFAITGRGGIPAAALAVTANLTVTDQTSSWAIYLGPTALTHPSASSLNFVVGEVRANGVSVGLSPSGTLSATYLGPEGATTHLVFDVTGYFLR